MVSNSLRVIYILWKMLHVVCEMQTLALLSLRQMIQLFPIKLFETTALGHVSYQILHELKSCNFS